jgi:hypothetical protein
LDVFGVSSCVGLLMQWMVVKPDGFMAVAGMEADGVIGDQLD